MVRIKDPENYKLFNYEIGTGDHKYFAILENKKTKKIKKIPFGNKKYQHYHDKLGHYSNLNHSDK